MWRYSMALIYSFGVEKVSRDFAKESKIPSYVPSSWGGMVTFTHLPVFRHLTKEASPGEFIPGTVSRVQVTPFMISGVAISDIQQYLSGPESSDDFAAEIFISNIIRNFHKLEVDNVNLEHVLTCHMVILPPSSASEKSS